MLFRSLHQLFCCHTCHIQNHIQVHHEGNIAWRIVSLWLFGKLYSLTKQCYSGLVSRKNLYERKSPCFIELGLSIDYNDKKTSTSKSRRVFVSFLCHMECEKEVSICMSYGYESCSINSINPLDTAP